MSISLLSTQSCISCGSVTVGVHYTYHYITPFGSLLDMLIGDLLIYTSTTMRVE